MSYGYETGTSRLQHVKLDRERIGGTELDLTYAYDDAGNVLSVKDRPTATGRAADRQCYQYDALRRLTEAWTPATGDCGLTRSIPALGGAAPYWTSFEYDALGNRTSETYRTRGLAGDIDGGQTTTMDYSYAGSRDLNADGDATDVGEFAGPHAVTSITTDGPSGSTAATFTYDGAGRTLTQTQDSDYLTTKLSLGWDHESELASTSTATTVYAEPEPGSGDDDSDGDQSSGTGPDRGTGTTTTAAGRNLYTADGDRIVRTAPDGSITVYLGGQEITKAANGTVTGARYYSFGGQTVAMRTVNGLGGVTSLINDPHGTPLASVHNTNWTTTSVDKHYTLPFGEQRGGVSAPGDHEFLGKVRDEATGLTLVGARWYDETVGRFLSVDPVMDLTDPEQWNGYSYANNNPVSWSDPTGLRPEKCMSGGYACGVKANGHLTVLGSSSDAKRWDPVSPAKVWAGLKNSFQNMVNGAKERAEVVYNVSSKCSWGVACFYSGVLLHDAVSAYSGAKNAFSQKTDFEKKVAAGDSNGLIADGIAAVTLAATTKTVLSKPVPLHGATAKGDALAAAMSKADALAPIRPSGARSTVAEGLGLPDGSTIAYGSKIGAAPVLNARIQEILNSIPVDDRGPGHGHCGLAQCLSEALDRGIDPTESDVAAVLVRGRADHPRHGFGIGPCNSCRPLVDVFRLNFVTGK